jgi:hypothetical protein
MRKFLVVPTLVFLAGCAARPAAVPTPAAPAERPVEESGPLIGMTADDLVRRFGTPALQVREGDSLKLQFRNPQCVLDAYLYPGGGAAYRVAHIDTRTRALAPVDQAACATSLQLR